MGSAGTWRVSKINWKGLKTWGKLRFNAMGKIWRGDRPKDLKSITHQRIKKSEGMWEEYWEVSRKKKIWVLFCHTECWFGQVQKADSKSDWPVSEPKLWFWGWSSCLKANNQTSGSGQVTNRLVNNPGAVVSMVLVVKHTVSHRDGQCEVGECCSGQEQHGLEI